MAQFMYLFRGPRMEMSSSEQDTHMKKWIEWVGALSQAGHFKSGEPFDMTGRVIRGREKRTTDGPYEDSKELVGGYLLVSAGNLAEATELAKGCPIFEHDGAVEVRPVLEMKI